MQKTEEWEGPERRAPEGVLIAIMNTVAEQIQHVEERHAQQYKQLDDKITHLAESITAWMDREPGAIVAECEKMIDEAIPSHPDDPSASPAEKRREHRKAHARWIENVAEEMAKWKRIREKITEWAVIGVLSVISLAVWHYLINGPKG